MSMETHDHGELELALRALREEQGTLEQARALEQRLLDKLGQKALLAPLAPAGTHLGRLTLLGGMTVLIGLLALLGRPQHTPRPPAEVPQEAQAPIASAAPAPLFVRPTTISVAPPRVETHVEPQRQKKRATRTSLGTPRAPAPPVVLPPREDELSMLHRAQAALRHSPDATLSITDQHAHHYPAGVFVEEREVLAIEALLKQKRTVEALDRAERFVTEQPASTYALQLREMLLTKPRVVSAALTPEPRRPAP